MGIAWNVACGVGHHLARCDDTCYDAATVESVDMQAIFVGAIFLGIGIIIGRRSRSTSADTLRVSMDEMRKEGAALRGRVERAEEQSARTGRTLDRLLGLLPADVRDRLASHSDNG